MEELKVGIDKSKFGDVKLINWEYDSEADVLYISFGEPRFSLSIDLGSGIILRQSEDKITGVTIIGLKEVLLSESNK